MVAVPVELVLGVSAEKDMVAVIPHMLVGMDVGVVNPLMAKPVTCAFREKSPPKRIIVASILLNLKFFMFEFHLQCRQKNIFPEFTQSLK